MAAMAASMPPWAVCTMAGGFLGKERMAASTAMPSVSGHDEVEQEQADIARPVGLQLGQRPLAAVGGGRRHSQTV